MSRLFLGQILERFSKARVPMVGDDKGRIVILDLLVNVLERRRDFHIRPNREGQTCMNLHQYVSRMYTELRTVRLTIIMVWVLTQYHDSNIRKRGEVRP